MRAKKEKKPAKNTCTFRYEIEIEISQKDARTLFGGFMPKGVRDALVAAVEEHYQKTAGRERIAKLGGM